MQHRGRVYSFYNRGPYNVSNPTFAFFLRPDTTNASILEIMELSVSQLTHTGDSTSKVASLELVRGKVNPFSITDDIVPVLPGDGVDSDSVQTLQMVMSNQVVVQQWYWEMSQPFRYIYPPGRYPALYNLGAFVDAFALRITQYATTTASLAPGIHFKITNA